MIGYLIVIDDTHADPEFRFRWEKEEAILEAEACLIESCGYYRDIHPDEWDRMTCNGKYGFWFSACMPCGSVRISVRELDVPERKNHYGLGRRVSSS